VAIYDVSGMQGTQGGSQQQQQQQEQRQQQGEGNQQQVREGEGQQQQTQQQQPLLMSIVPNSRCLIYVSHSQEGQLRCSSMLALVLFLVLIRAPYTGLARTV